MEIREKARGGSLSSSGVEDLGNLANSDCFSWKESNVWEQLCHRKNDLFETHTFIANSKATELRIIFEGLDANWASSFNSDNSLLALLNELRRTLSSSSSLLIDQVKKSLDDIGNREVLVSHYVRCMHFSSLSTYRESDFLNAGMDVNNSSVTSANNIFVIENGELGIKLVGGLYWLLSITNDETIWNFLFRYEAY